MISCLTRMMKKSITKNACTILRKRQDANKHLCKLSSISSLFLAHSMSASITSPKTVTLSYLNLLNTNQNI